MKKINFLVLTTIFTAGLLAGCGNSKPSTINIDIGTKETKATEIASYSDLVSKIQIENGEDFLLATYSKAFSTGCSCWTGFQFEVIDRYVKETHTPIYYFDVDKLEETKEFGISKLYASDPEFYVFKGNKAIRKYQYSAKTHNIMTSYNNFKKEMSLVVNTPSNYSLYYVNEDFLDENLENQEEQNLLIMRNGCGDCRYAIPNAIIPMTKIRSFSKELWVFDIQSYKSNEASYLNIKVKYNLNEGANPLFGYGQGVVPTIQHYEKGLLKDAAVYFNDELVQDGENYKISKTYYTEARIKSLSFTKKSTVQIKSLEGLTIPASDVTNGFWNQDAASKVHTPIMQAFITTYCL